MIIKTPLSLKWIWFFRHLLERETLWSNWEKSIVERVSANHAHSPKVPSRPVREITREAFLALPPEFFKNKAIEPFVVRQFIHGEKLSADYLKANGSDVELPVHPSADLSAKATRTFTQKMRLGDLLSHIEAGRKVSSIAATDIFKARPEFAKLAGTPMLEGLLGADNIVKRELFIGSKGAGSNYHRAYGDNYFVMLDGRKTWRLADPRQMVAMYPEIGRLRDSAVTTSSVNQSGLSKGEFPLFSQVEVHTVTLEPGDMLFNPDSWWHEVENESVAMGAPHRVMTRRHPTFIHLLMTLRPETVRFLKEKIGNMLRRDSATPLTLSDQQGYGAYGAKQ